MTELCDEISLVRELHWRGRAEFVRPRIMLIGIGGLGSQVLNGLVRLGDAVELIAAGRDVLRIQVSANAAMFSAMQATDNVARVECVALDLSSIDATTKALEKLRPDLVVHCATMQPYASIAALPPESKSLLATVGLGPWLPAHLALVGQLMHAIEQSGVVTLVVNCAYPDAVNPALATVGRAPLIGTGNIANNEPAIRRAISDALAVELSDISVMMVMHHYVSHRIHRFGDAGRAPFHLSYQIGTSESKCQIAPERLFELLASRYRRQHAEGEKQIPAASTVALVSALIGTTARKLHAPGPCALVGGFPVEVSRNRVAIVPPASLKLRDAIKINKIAQRFDGIEEIGMDGVVAFTEEATAAFSEVLGHQCSKFHVDEAREWACELIAHCEERRRL